MEEIYKWILGIIGILLGALWRENKKTQSALDKRLSDVEKNAVTKGDFSEFKKDLKADFNKLMAKIDSLNDKVVTRETAGLIAENKCSEALLKHANNCPFAKAALNRNNQ